jgi:hypothetical protein
MNKEGTDRIIIVGLLPNENWFISNRYIYDTNGISPCVLALSGGCSNGKIKVMDIVYED